MSFTNFKTNESLSIDASELEQLSRARMAELTALLDLKLRALKKSPEGTLRITQSNHSVQYYHRTKPTDHTGKYIPATQKEQAAQLAQKDYDKKIVAATKTELKFLSAFLRTYTKLVKNHMFAEDVYSKLHKNRRLLVASVKLSDQEFASRWQTISYKKDFSPENKNYLTAKGEAVRSKSEILIADTLNRMNIPYHYEFPIKLLAEDGTKITVHPDFLCLNPRTHKEFLWEHFGRMDDIEYATGTVRKLNLFAKNGIFPGKNLITTHETSDQPLNTSLIKKIAEEFLV
jgi:hypothetical protein